MIFISKLICKFCGSATGTIVAGLALVKDCCIFMDGNANAGCCDGVGRELVVKANRRENLCISNDNSDKVSVGYTEPRTQHLK